MYKANLIGIIAPIGWSMIPILFFFLQPFNSIFATALIFLFFFLIDFVRQLIFGKIINPFAISIGYYLTGTLGMAIFYICYFMALTMAPIIAVFLISYLSGVLKIFYAKLFYNLPIERKHIIAAIFNVAAVILVAINKKSESFELEHLWGYFLAFIAANSYALYSVGKKRYNNISIDYIMYSALLSSLIAFVAYFLLGGNFTVDFSTKQLYLILALSFFPMGYAFLAWNYGLKYGDIRILGLFSYIAPVLSIIWLIIFGLEQFNYYILTAIILIISGALSLKIFK
ncbi:MAG: DMT family transporter [Alphaproteobacteria bacterium]|jgi:drug/metabolite transporter (DMT)-like permease|nr:DMT family transporter [Alphaproteobacteria bacterium]